MHLRADARGETEFRGRFFHLDEVPFLPLSLGRHNPPGSLCPDERMKQSTQGNMWSIFRCILGGRGAGCLLHRRSSRRLSAKPTGLDELSNASFQSLPWMPARTAATNPPTTPPSHATRANSTSQENHRTRVFHKPLPGCSRVACPGHVRSVARLPHKIDCRAPASIRATPLL
jgi:hypothetical protein